MTTREERRKAREASERKHARHILATYGLTSEEYRACHAFQGGKCAICCRATGRTRRLAVDHDHRCTAGHEPSKACAECRRGLLCSFCNRLLGRMGDDPEAFLRAARYLREPPFQLLRQQAA